ncbi:MAG TPA: tetratricopeptide repeat protein [Candidatus Acidoferrum sp.]|jgi:HTH-type transcriptional regulator, quorum sensing regulator NprR|nr:tetratricopeptide repeat protein [Candidatus Acidoferrum sp.]
MNSVGERLRQARLARGLTQEQLARGVATKGFISQVECNRATPSLSKLRLMAERLGMPLGHFTGDPSPMELTYLRKSAELAVKAKEPAHALALVDEAAPLASTANERADLQRVRGKALDALGRLPEALIALQTAAADAPPDDPELNGAIYTEIATVLNEQEQFNFGVEAGRRALLWLERAKHADPALRSRVLTNLGRSCWGLGQLEEAHRFFVQSLEAATDAESLFRIANAHMSLGVTARAKGLFDEAIEHCNRALEIHARIGQERAANRILNNIGDIHYAAGRKAEAWDAQSRCLQRARQLSDDLAVGSTAGALARYALDAGKDADALELARKSQRAAERSQDHLHQALAAAIEGAAAERLGHPVVADRRFRAAIRMLVDREASGKLGEVCAMYADVLRHRGEQDRAFAVMRMAAERDFSNLPALLRAGT